MDLDKINPQEIIKKLNAMMQEDFNSYTDAKTKKLRSNISIPIIECPACNHESKKSENIFEKGPFEYKRCAECGLVYTASRLIDELINKLYREGRCMYQTKEFYLPNAEYRKNHVYVKKLSEIERIKKPGSLLDFGSSTGYFASAAQERGWDTFGIELNPFGVQWSREKLGLNNIYDKPINECGFDPDFFDIITLWDVLEHIPNPFDILKQLGSLLKNDGYIVIETSHYECFETEILGSENTNIVGDMHLMHFTKKSLETLLHRAGFSNVTFEIFGLDMKHISNYHNIMGSKDFAMPEAYISNIQKLIDGAGQGCYIKAIAKIN